MEENNNENKKKVVIGGDQKQTQNIPKEFVNDEFLTPTEEIELPSKGVFYKNNKSTVKIKYLTAEEEDVLFSPELIKSGRVLDALLKIAVVDKDINTDDMIVGDRNAVLIYLRRTGFGDIYKPGKTVCPSCNEEYIPEIDLSELKMKWIEEMPDEEGYYDFLMPTMKKNIKFRMLNGRDENRISKAISSSGYGTKKGSYRISKSMTERYKMQIVEVEGNRDKLYISKFVSAMPMKDAAAFREYVKLISPGVDFNYTFECNLCGHTYEDEVVMNHRLFYPNAEL